MQGIGVGYGLPRQVLNPVTSEYGLRMLTCGLQFSAKRFDDSSMDADLKLKKNAVKL
jgi:hypothetical protein